MELIKNIFSRLQNFGREVWHSAYDLTWYREVRASHTVGRSVRYFLILQAIIVAITAAIFFVVMLPLPDMAAKVISEKIPDGAYVSIAEGRFETSLPDDWSYVSGDFRIVVSDALEGQTPPVVAEKSWIAIGRDAAFVYDGTTLRTNDFKTMPNFRIDKAQAIEWVRGSLPTITRTLALALTLVAYILFSLMNASQVVMLAYIAHWLSRLAKAPIAFNRWMTMGFRFTTLSLLVVAVMRLLGLNTMFAFSFVFLMMAVTVIMDERNNPLEKEKGESPGVQSPDSNRQ